jgi:hypothetical protein
VFHFLRDYELIFDQAAFARGTSFFPSSLIGGFSATSMTAHRIQAK